MFQPTDLCLMHDKYTIPKLCEIEIVWILEASITQKNMATLLIVLHWLQKWFSRQSHPHTQQSPTLTVNVSGSKPVAQCTVYFCTLKNLRLPVRAPPLMSSDLDWWLEEATCTEINPLFLLKMHIHTSSICSLLLSLTSAPQGNRGRK